MPCDGRFSSWPRRLRSVRRCRCGPGGFPVGATGCPRSRAPRRTMLSSFALQKLAPQQASSRLLQRQPLASSGCVLVFAVIWCGNPHSRAPRQKGRSSRTSSTTTRKSRGLSSASGTAPFCAVQSGCVVSWQRIRSHIASKTVAAGVVGGFCRRGLAVCQKAPFRKRGGAHFVQNRHRPTGQPVGPGRHYGVAWAKGGGWPHQSSVVLCLQLLPPIATRGTVKRASAGRHPAFRGVFLGRAVFKRPPPRRARGADHGDQVSGRVRRVAD